MVNLSYVGIETFADRVREALDELGQNQAGLARAVKVSEAAITQWLDGTTDPGKIRTDNMQRAAAFLRRTTEFLRTGRGPKTYSGVGEAGARYDNALPGEPDIRELPVISYVQAGVWSETSDPFPRGQGMEAVPVDADLARSLSRVAFALKIQGDSMLPEFAEGDVVIIDPRATVKPGDFVVAKLDREECATFKKYRDRGVDRDGVQVFDLVPLNHDYPTLTVSAANPGRIIGVMVEHRRRRRSR